MLSLYVYSFVMFIYANVSLPKLFVHMTTVISRCTWMSGRAAAEGMRCAYYAALVASM